MTEKERETESTEENAKEREDNAGERGTMRNDEDGTMDETQTQSHDLRSIEEPFDSVKNVEGSVVVRDERGEIESAETMVETEKKDFEEGYEIEYEYEEKKKSGKKDKMDEDEDTLECSPLSIAVFHCDEIFAIRPKTPCRYYPDLRSGVPSYYALVERE
ncbi:hypothetical protein DY000_02009168 [Brassica cretica]|uniref:Uncharacterized protein n=1 Tax=Brassica cretica TaxID=69181 RepID=A0ABQ7C508_BRACR|nr:hypothetical protein DY000_02009168 [Brassica cretica]